VKIVEYDEVDPLLVLAAARLALDFSLKPELAQRIRQNDPRPLPCLSVVAVEHGLAVGHVGVYCLPMLSVEGRGDVGGVWAVSTHPMYRGRGAASHLLEEAHARIRAVGLRFSTLETDQSRLAHRLYRRLCYQETNVRVKLNRPIEVTSLRRSGFDVAQPTWSGFMVKPLLLELTFEYTRRLYGIGTDGF
jgi:GNAT superfamily N-acetyltransferase